MDIDVPPKAKPKNHLRLRSVPPLSHRERGGAAAAATARSSNVYSPVANNIYNMSGLKEDRRLAHKLRASPPAISTGAISAASTAAPSPMPTGRGGSRASTPLASMSAWTARGGASPSLQDEVFAPCFAWRAGSPPATRHSPLPLLSPSPAAFDEEGRLDAMPEDLDAPLSPSDWERRAVSPWPAETTFARWPDEPVALPSATPSLYSARLPSAEEQPSIDTQASTVLTSALDKELAKLMGGRSAASSPGQRWKRLGAAQVDNKQLRPRAVWQPRQWLEAREEAKDSGRPADSVALLQLARAFADQAIVDRQYWVEPASFDGGGKGGHIKMSNITSLMSRVDWFGRGNCRDVDQQLAAGSMKPVNDDACAYCEPKDCLDLALTLRETGRIDPWQTVHVLVEACGFDSNGMIDGSAMNPPDLLIRTDIAKYLEEAQTSLQHWARGGASASNTRRSHMTHKCHLAALHNPYLMRCPEVTIFRGPMSEGYPFLLQPMKVVMTITAMARQMPQPSSIDVPLYGAVDWFNDPEDFNALHERLTLLGLSALEDNDDGAVNSHNQASPAPALLITAPGAGERRQPTGALASLLKRWRKRFAPFFADVYICCATRNGTGDLGLAEYLNPIVNKQQFPGAEVERSVALDSARARCSMLDELHKEAAQKQQLADKAKWRETEQAVKSKMLKSSGTAPALPEVQAVVVDTTNLLVHESSPGVDDKSAAQGAAKQRSSAPVPAPQDAVRRSIAAAALQCAEAVRSSTYMAKAVKKEEEELTEMASRMSSRFDISVLDLAELSQEQQSWDSEDSAASFREMAEAKKQCHSSRRDISEFDFVAGGERVLYKATPQRLSFVTTVDQMIARQKIKDSAAARKAKKQRSGKGACSESSDTAAAAPPAAKKKTDFFHAVLGAQKQKVKHDSTHPPAAVPAHGHGHHGGAASSSSSRPKETLAEGNIFDINLMGS
eukprot:TRINITY_DN26348_c0_g2_i1.p1 TRINITY_DN26348_c0_g2~~TRINITY_DN26348_c0_g2_i1.p1  ORF type:complete len:956 (+),score=234.36 TRINITY_DN26348_c0_g2_i1:107-2974(+)